MVKLQRVIGVLILGAMGAVGSACAAKVQAVTPTGAPALKAPEPPARVVVPAAERPTVPGPPDEPVPATTGGTAPGRGRETPPVRTTPPPPNTPPVETAPVVAPPPVLLTTSNSPEFEKRVRAQIQKAQTDLGQVNPRTLGADARAQYDSALGFIRQAEDALKVKNLVYAGQLADKAATMAALLKR
jgi:hypothetical protein